MAVKKLRRLSILVLFVSLAARASALTVGVAPAEGKAYAPPPDGQGSPIGYLVTGCMSILFEAGYIATDAPVSRTDRASWGTADYGLVGAKAGLVDYIIALYAAWVPSSFYNKKSLPATVDYRLVRVADGKVMAEGSVDGPPDSEDAASHEARTASQAGASAAAPCVRLLSTLAKGGE